MWWIVITWYFCLIYLRMGAFNVVFFLHCKIIRYTTNKCLGDKRRDTCWIKAKRGLKHKIKNDNIIDHCDCVVNRSRSISTSKQWSTIVWLTVRLDQYYPCKHSQALMNTMSNVSEVEGRTKNVTCDHRTRVKSRR